MDADTAQYIVVPIVKQPRFIIRPMTAPWNGKGRIDQIGIRFCSAGSTPHPARFGGVAQRLTETAGIGGRSAATQLRGMIAEGQIERINRTRYAYIQW